MTKLLITLFLGWAGVHKFMEKKTRIGILYLFTFGLFGVGWFVDIIIAVLNMSKTAHPSDSNRNLSSSPRVQLTQLSGYRKIHALKNYNQTNMYALQQLVLPGSKKGTVTNEQIIRLCDTTINRAEDIIDDCKKLISSTENPSVFYERYNLLIEQYTELTQFEPFIVLFGYQPIESLAYYRESKSSFEKKLIDRCYNKSLIKADSLKTEKARKNQFIKMHESLQQYEYMMNAETLAYMAKKFKSKTV